MVSELRKANVLPFFSTWLGRLKVQEQEQELEQKSGADVKGQNRQSGWQIKQDPLHVGV